MFNPVAQPTDADSLWLLVPPLPPPPAPPARSAASLLMLEVWATLTGAPSVIPSEFWQTPVASLDLTNASALLRHLFTTLTTRIPFLWWEPLERATSFEDLRAYLRIPVHPAGIDMCGGDVIYGGGVLMWVAALYGYPVEEDIYPRPEDLPEGLDIWALDAADFTIPDEHPLTGLLAILNLLEQTTGTFFLDACPSCWMPQAADFTQWDEENLTWLADHAAQTLLIFQRIDVLEAWVAEDPTRIDMVCQTLVDAHAAHIAQPPARPQTLAEAWGVVPDEHSPSEAVSLEIPTL